MKMDKQRYAHLLALADNAVNAVLAPSPGNQYQVDSQYNGHIAAFGVSVLMSGIKPTLAYFKGSTDETKTILKLLGHMVIGEGFPEAGENYATPEGLYAAAISMNEERMSKFKTLVLECSVALKHVIRTYNLN